ncbi:MAG: hypothetical protein EA358_08855 [Flavobacteriales bacterium]|nr:MAG: hypothetical protein EA358_08855 [Flavobacteriales bacterium]
MTYATHPNTSFANGFFWKHLAIVLPFTAPPAIIFGLKGELMLAGDITSILWAIPAIASLIFPHMYIRKEHLSIMKNIVANGSLQISPEGLRWSEGDKRIELDKSNIVRIRIADRYLHRWVIGKSNHAFLRIKITAKERDSQTAEASRNNEYTLLVSNQPLDGKILLQQAIEVYT